ncbi:MAG: M28 family peptidase [Candidatus Acidiferrales bacterium]
MRGYVKITGGWRVWVAIGVLACALGCNGNGSGRTVSANAPAVVLDAQDKAPPPQQTGGFDGQRAYDNTAKLVSFGPHPSGSDAIKRVQNYIYSELHNDGCKIDEDDFHAQTPIGTIPMKNIIAKVPGTGKGIILLMTHYDTVRTVPDFVGAEDGGSSTGLMLEMARHLCGRKPQLAIWMAFLDGEEAMVDWNTNDDHTYGSRELAAKMELDGDLKDVKAVILADMIGQKGLTMKKESSSTPWLVDLIWSTAAKLGYGNIFVSQSTGASDDHDPFLAKKVPAVDLIDLDDYIAEGYWHTPQDTMDKISAKNLAIVGHVMLASVDALETKFSK